VTLAARADALGTDCAALMRSPAGLVLPGAARALIVDLVRLVRELAATVPPHQPPGA
jgi:hypothetical protein